MINNYNTFISEQKAQEETNNVSDIKIEPIINNYIIEVQTEKKNTFNKIIHKIAKLCKFINIPVPVVTKLEDIKYYTIGVEEKQFI
jgi:hypothetical protein